MLVKSQGIVIKAGKYSESSLIVKIYTRAHGMLSFLVPGVYSKKSSNKASFFLVLQCLDMNYYFMENRNLQKIREIKCDPVLRNIHFDIARSISATMISELIHTCIKEEEANPALFDYLRDTILLLDNKAPFREFLPAFLIHFSRFLGFYPGNRYSEKTSCFDMEAGVFCSCSGNYQHYIYPPESVLLSLLMDTEPASPVFPVQDKKTVQTLFAKLINYYKIHITSFKGLKSFEIFKSVFEK
jgi:DNA repair protein RecO (recombination protein O)